MASCFWIVAILIFASLVSSNENSIQVVPSDVDEASVSVDEGSGTFDTSNVFVPTTEWQPVLPGQVVPAGLHVRINLQTGVKEAKLLEKDEAKDGDPKPFESSIGKINDGPKDETPSKSGLRSFQELQDIMAKQKMKMNTEFEQIEYLVSHYANSTVSQKLLILEDLDYFLHQYDNSRDFVTLGGLESIVGAALNATDSALREKAAIVFGAMVQSHPDVQERALSANWMARLLWQLTRDGEEERVRLRLVHAVSCLVRGHTRSRTELDKLDGLAVLAKLASQSQEPKMKLKVLTFFQDLSVDQSTLGQSKEALCSTIDDLWQKSRPDDIYEVERFVDILHFFLATCDLPRNEILDWLSHVKSELNSKLNEDDEDEISAVFERIQLFIAALSRKTEL